MDELEKMIAFQNEIGGPTMPRYKMGITFFFRVKSGLDVKLTTHFHYVPKLKINGALPP